YIVETLYGIFAIDEGGTLVNFIDFGGDETQIVEFFKNLKKGIHKKEYANLLAELKNSGFTEYVYDNEELEQLTSNQLNYNTSLEEKSLEFRSFRLNLIEQLKKVGLYFTFDELSERFKRVNEFLIKEEISQLGEQSDVIIVQISESLDIIKKSISNFSMRLKEWYGLHFPELTDKIVEDELLLANLVSKVGSRKHYSKPTLEQYFDFDIDFIDYLESKANASMGSDIDIQILQGFSQQILSLDAYREELEDYLDDLMNLVAPNLKAIVGSLISAKLIAKAGSLKKLAFMPSSRIQLLGAEKALYRFLKTGSKRPKHGLIFQWNQIRSSKPHHRGKIARLVAAKLSLASKVDYFKGDYIGDELALEVDQKIEEIKQKYPTPPKKKSSKKQRSKKKKKRGKEKR
ncbi:MAG: C/D box methylation guide ribonucleoprotein complex aNOP56 subunit, partial [Candidatus Lokiarchaeota archaeon]|nr:C/D box methylation guide ribonucleoprotein complex aNOP56 subunit [Candidatus Lokiarchaeota archaeon]